MIKNLKYPPIKYNLKKIPEILVYYSRKTSYYHDFVMGKTSKPYATCRMYCNVTNLHYDNKLFKSLIVFLIESKPRKQGLGFKMLDVIQQFSKKKGCEGRFHLFATAQYAMDDAPHIFYRKYGMTSGDKKIDKKLDKFIKKGKNATYKDFNSMLMYYFPPNLEKEKPKLTCFEKLKKFVSKIFN